MAEDETTFDMLMRVLLSTGARVFVFDEEGASEVVPLPAQIPIPFPASSTDTNPEENGLELVEEEEEEDLSDDEQADLDAEVDEILEGGDDDGT